MNQDFETQLQVIQRALGEVEVPVPLAPRI
jgi:hypothetical protein